MTTIEATGAEGVRQYWSSYHAAFETVRTDIEQVSQAPGVATVQRTTHHKRAAGVMSR